MTSFSDDWILLLKKGNRTSRVVGYDFDLNSATAKILCKDKSATSDLLGAFGVPRVEHQIFYGPQLKGYVPPQGNWRRMLAQFESFGRDAVCKPNEGTGGHGVIRVRTEQELENATLQIFERNRALCLSRFEKIAGEYRVALLSDDVHFVYRKERLSLVGDGRTSIRGLLISRIQNGPVFAAEIEAAMQLTKEGVDLNRVPAIGEQVLINWRHNLSGGAIPHLFDLGAPEIVPFVELARRAMAALGVTLASVDVVATAEGIKILEINSGIMMENLARHFPKGYELAYRFYDHIVCASLDLERT